MATTPKKTSVVVAKKAPAKAAPVKAAAVKATPVKTTLVAPVAVAAAPVAVAPVAAPAVKKPSAAKTKLKASTMAAPALNVEQRNHYVAVAAFYIAERRGFTLGDPADDWLAAEAEVDRLIASGHFIA